jgi:hypothetical protein
VRSGGAGEESKTKIEDLASLFTIGAATVGLVLVVQI